MLSASGLSLKYGGSKLGNRTSSVLRSPFGRQRSVVAQLNALLTQE